MKNVFFLSQKHLRSILKLKIADKKQKLFVYYRSLLFEFRQNKNILMSVGVKKLISDQKKCFWGTSVLSWSPYFFSSLNKKTANLFVPQVLCQYHTWESMYGSTSQLQRTHKWKETLKVMRPRSRRSEIGGRIFLVRQKLILVDNTKWWRFFT